MAAVRLLKWIRFLSTKNNGDMRQQRLLLIVSQIMANSDRHRQALGAALGTFKEIFSYVPEFAEERGWPASPNAMFKWTLEHVEQHFGDEMFLVEPDAVPVTPDWFQQVEAEYYGKAVPEGKNFMGGFVKFYKDHMTGNAVYGRDWRKFAPKLIEAKTEAWDTYASDQVMPNAHITPLIQHIFYNPLIETLGILEPKTVLFHQDKQGTLIKLLDQERFGGELYAGRFDIVERAPYMTKYFHTANASRPIPAAGDDIVFIAYELFAGAWQGVYAAEKESEAIALETVSRNISSGITEISESEYEAALKKKGIARQALVHSPSPLTPPAQLRLEEKAGVVVDGDKVPPAVIPQSPTPLPEDVEDVIKVGAVKPLEAAPVPPKVRRQRKAPTTAPAE